jgi:hypothetical protein
MQTIAYVLAKNEANNIHTCVRALVAADLMPIVLDSQSTDSTALLARSCGAFVEDYQYRSHAEAYNWITENRTPIGAGAIVLDADMIVSAGLVREAREALIAGTQAVVAPVSMYWNGKRLRWASLCPPKAFAFRGGAAYFEAAGHTERLRRGVCSRRTRRTLVHDDRKAFLAFLQSQDRYAHALLERATSGAISWRDRIRLSVPLLAVAIPFVSYFVRGGILDGRAGVGYAMDRLIAEAILYRQALASKATSESRDPSESNGL